MKSNFLSLNATDFLKGLVVAIGTALLTGLYDLLQKGATFDWATIKPVVIAAVAAGVAYLLKNLFTNSQNQLGVSEKNATAEKVKPLTPVAKILILAIMFSGIGIAAQGQNAVSIWKPVPKNLLQLEKVTITTPQALASPGVWIWRFQAAIVATELTYDKTLKQWQSNALSAVGPGVGYKYYTTNADGTLINTFGFNFLLLLSTDIEKITLASIKPALTISAFNFLNIGVDYGNSKVGLLLGATVTF